MTSVLGGFLEMTFFCSPRVSKREHYHVILIPRLLVLQFDQPVPALALASSRFLIATVLSCFFFDGPTGAGAGTSGR